MILTGGIDACFPWLLESAIVVVSEPRTASAGGAGRAVGEGTGGAAAGVGTTDPALLGALDPPLFFGVTAGAGVADLDLDLNLDLIPGPDSCCVGEMEYGR